MTEGHPAATAGSADDPGRRRRLLLLAGLAVAVIALDLLTKTIAVRTLTPGGASPRILGGLVYFSILRNAGAAFSMATGVTWVLSLVVVGVIVFIIRMARRLRSTAWAVWLGLVLGGAIGNLLDRIFRSPGFLRGHVVDFISVFGPDAKYFPAFNVADSAITVGGLALVLTAMFFVDFDGRRVRSRQSAAPAAPAAPAADKTGPADGG